MKTRIAALLLVALLMLAAPAVAVTKTVINLPNITVLVFNGTPGTTTWTVPTGLTSVDYLIVAGGGGGGWNHGGGGGAGGLLNGTDTNITAGTSYIIQIGQGGAPTADGTNSTFSLNRAKGGGAGGDYNEAGNTGGSGGGSNAGYSGAAPYSGQGNYGGSGYNGGDYGAGGGGGATTNGIAGASNDAGSGGSGFTSSITGASVIYAAGGGGGINSDSRYGYGGSSGIGGHGGNNSYSPTNGAVNTGSGGGGGNGATRTGAYGADGIVILRFTSDVTPGPDFTQSAVTEGIWNAVKFTDVSTGAPLTWDWNFGDGSANETTQNPSHTYGGTGTYTVTLIITNPFGTASIKKTQTIKNFNDTLRLYIPANSTPIKDRSNYDRVMTPLGSAASSAGWYKFGGASLYLPRNGSSSLSTPASSTNFAFGTSDYTVAMWIFPYQNSTYNKYGIVSFGGKYGSTNPMFGLGLDTSGHLKVIGGTAGTWLKTSSATILRNVSTYILVRRQGLNQSVWINGVNQTDMAYQGLLDYGTTAYNNSIGWDTDQPSAESRFDGFMDEVQVWIGTALDGSVVPTAELLPVPTATAPASSFTASNTSGLQPVIAHFTDTSSQNPTGWGWNATCLENSTRVQFSTQQNPDQVFDAGHWLIELIASNAYGQGTSTQQTWINVSSAVTPVSIFSANKTVILFPGIVGFTDLSQNAPTSWNWSFGDGTYSTARNATHQYVHRGRWNVTLNATNIAGSSINGTTLIYVFGG